MLLSIILISCLALVGHGEVSEISFLYNHFLDALNTQLSRVVRSWGSLGKNMNYSDHVSYKNVLWGYNWKEKLKFSDTAVYGVQRSLIQKGRWIAQQHRQHRLYWWLELLWEPSWRVCKYTVCSLDNLLTVFQIWLTWILSVLTIFNSRQNTWKLLQTFAHFVKVLEKI